MEEVDILRAVLAAYDDVAQKHSGLSREARLRIKQYEDSFLERARTDKRLIKGLKEAVRDLRVSIFDLPHHDREEFLALVKERTGTSFFGIVGYVDSDVEKVLARGKFRGEYDIRLLIDYISDFPHGVHAQAAKELLEKCASKKRSG